MSDVFPVVRLLMAPNDDERQIKIRTTDLGKMLCGIEYISENGEDYKVLQDWKANVGKPSARDFAEVFRRQWLKRKTSTKPKGMLIDEVNQHLDELVGSDTKQRTESISSVYHALPLDHFMWFIRILLRDTHQHVQEADYFAAIHCEARDVFRAMSSLRFACMPLRQVDSRHTTLGIGKCFRPQLAHSPVAGETVDKFLLASVKVLDVRRVKAATFPGLTLLENYFFIEEKMDGERVQVHVSRATGDRVRYRWWTRNGTDRTDLYGSHVPEADSADAPAGFAITRHLGDLVNRKSPFSLVLDGEVVAWDPSQERVLPVNFLMKAAQEQKASHSNTKPWPMFCAFDIVYLDCPSPAGSSQQSEPVQGKSQQARREILRSLLKYVPRHFEVVNAVKGTSLDQLRSEFYRVMLAGGEGLIIKNPFAKYLPGQRPRHWVKIKPNRVAELQGTPFKCIIVGANRGEGRNAGVMSSYLCAVAKDDDRSSFLTCIKVPCNGRPQQQAIEESTNGKWVDWDRTKPPTFLTLGRSSHERPDCWIRPRDSVLVSVSCSEVLASNLFPTGKALRFPVLEGVHLDDWASCMTLAGFEAHIAKAPAHFSRSL